MHLKSKTKLNKSAEGKVFRRLRGRDDCTWLYVIRAAERDVYGWPWGIDRILRESCSTDFLEEIAREKNRARKAGST